MNFIVNMTYFTDNYRPIKQKKERFYNKPAKDCQAHTLKYLNK